jgi:hypothetical protein
MLRRSFPFTFHVPNAPQYQQHWADPSKTKIIWIGLLYAMITISMMSYKMSKKVPPEYQGTAPAIAELYRVRTAQCLMIADLTKPVSIATDLQM